MLRLLIFWLALSASLPVAADACQWNIEDPLARPGADQGATVVTAKLYVNDITAINDVEQSFEADVMFRADWQDPRLAHNNPTPCVLDPESAWTPVLQPLNRRKIERIRPPQLSVARDGTVTFMLRTFGEFSFRADLSDFPFDTQKLGFYLVSRFGPEQVEFQTAPELIGMAQELSVANWRVQLNGFEIGTEYIPPVDQHLARLDLLLQAERRSSYYTWQQITPLLLVVMMTWVVFWIPFEFVPARVALAATSMLTLIAYRFAIASALPPIAYLTRLDRFLIGSSVLVFLALAGAVAVSYIAEKHGEDHAHGLNRTARWMSPALLIAVLWASFAA